MIDKILAYMRLCVIKEKSKRIDDAVFRMKGELSKLDDDLQVAKALEVLNTEINEVLRVKRDNQFERNMVTEKAYELTRILN